MAKTQLTLKFDHNLDFQQKAIHAVVDVFEGLPRYDTAFTLGGGTVPNLPESEWLSEHWLLENVIAVQERQKIHPISALEVDEGMVLEGAGNGSWRYPSFTVEMETGTGKTYVYLRTIYELRRQYGFRKFIIVVPSIAIYEGVIKSYQVMEPHFRSLYGNENVHLLRYDGAKLSTLRGFANSSFVEVMVMTLQSFNTAKGRTTNTIFRASEKLPGERKPYQYVQETRPILILDEPQNMESDKAKAALRALHPLFALRYSATHRQVHNLVHILTPFEAYQKGLVKKIQVDGVFEQQNLDAETVLLREVKKSPLRAVVTALGNVDGQARAIEVELRNGDNLFTKTRRTEHEHGYIVSEISARRNNTFVDFDGHDPITSEDVFSRSKQAIFKIQIERTIERHMRAQHDLMKRGIKVLSLFFIDRVANYVNDDGLIKVLFDEAYESIKQCGAKDVRRGYFARSKPKQGEEKGDAIDTTNRNKAEREAEKEAFRLIMREKEQLLSFEEPVSFIFAHSALKEGWDNPNVFQICTLNQTVSEMKKRQEFGRGLRLPVDQNGERIFDDAINILTVVANESYEGYASRLQTEYREAGYDKLPPKPTRVGTSTARRNDAVFNDSEFRAFWEQLTQKSTYTIQIDTEELVQDTVLEFNKNKTREKLDPKIVIERGKFVITKFEIELLSVAVDAAQIKVRKDTTENALFPEELKKTYRNAESLSGELNEPRLRGFRLCEIEEDGESSYVIFEKDQKLMVGETVTFESESGQKPITRTVEAAAVPQGIFNLIDRAAKETGLTRRTIYQIFKKVRRDYKELFLKNPEGFANNFISTIKDCFADHIVDNLEFKFDVGSFEDFPIEEFFPENKDFPQKELVEAGSAGMYDRVQVDSYIERDFVSNCLSGYDPKVIGYFKFPPAYKVNLPRVIGNYNPDWGILRQDDEGKVVLRLVRETKGGEDPRRLRFSSEGRKISAAEKHFDKIGVDYRMITDDTSQWYLPRNYHSIMEPRIPYGDESEENEEDQA